MQLRVLTILKSLAGLGDEHASIVALDLLDTWWHRKEEAFDPLLVEVAIEFAILPSPMNSDMYDFRWLEVLKLVLTHKPEVVAQLIVDRITDHNGMHWTSNHPVVDVRSKASAANPSLAMQAIGNSILDSNRLPMFGVCIYRGLFEPIGLDAVRNWIELNGTEHLEYIARHLQSPYIRQDGEVAMQDITRWLLDDQENNQEAFDCFLMGRSDGAFHWQGDQTVNKREEMEPFLNHPLRRVRQWATYEIERVSGDAKFFQKMDDERGRL